MDEVACRRSGAWLHSEGGKGTQKGPVGGHFSRGKVINLDFRSILPSVINENKQFAIILNAGLSQINYSIQKRSISEK